MKKIVGIFVLILGLCGCASLNLWGGSGSSVTVQKGDTLYSISRRYNVPIKDLININHMVSPYTLYVGQKISLPTKQYHIVQRGESLYSIARIYNVDITSYAKISNIKITDKNGNTVTYVSSGSPNTYKVTYNVTHGTYSGTCSNTIIIEEKATPTPIPQPTNTPEPQENTE